MNKPLATQEKPMKLEHIEGHTYRGYITTLSSEAKEYYLVPPPHCIAIPICATSNDSYQVLCCGLKDWSLPETVYGLPICNHMVLDQCMKEYLIVPVLKEKLVAKPIETLSPMEEDIIREAKKKQSHISRKIEKPRVVGTLDLSSL